MLVLENLHWGDEATLDVITLVAARIDSVPRLWWRAIAMMRSSARPPYGWFWLSWRGAPIVSRSNRSRGRRLRRWRIRPALDAAQLYDLTGGNPFFVTEVLAAGGEKLPETVRDAVLARTATLSPPARRLLEAIAVVPGEIELWLLEKLVGKQLDQLDECLAAGMLRATATTVAIRHELARLALEEAISPNRRLVLHRAAIEALAARDDPDFARLAHHAEAAGDADAVSRWTPLGGRAGGEVRCTSRGGDTL